MTSVRRVWRLALAVSLVGLVVSAAPAQARPTYFAAFTSLYGIGDGDNLNACGVCHIKWAGTGARNPFGNAVEQQLYLGKSITQSIMDVEGADTDGDGFTNGDEIMTYMTLPGYSCDNFFQAIDPPNDWHTFVTPMVASCLVPHDIRVSPVQLGFLTEAGDVATSPLEIFNNGSSAPLEISAYELVSGVDPALTISSGPAVPFTIPVNGSVIVEVQFAPTDFVFLTDTLRITSDDPDEPTLDVPIQAFGVVSPMAPAEDRAACLRDIDKSFRRYAKTHLKEWNRCYLDELKGVACNEAKRDLKIAKTESKMRSIVGGAKDRRCSGNGVTPSLLGYPDFCGGGCGAIEVNTFSDYVDCVTCRQDEARDALMTAAAGTAPPDLPSNLIAGQAAVCQKQLLKQAEKAVAKALKTLDRCELDNITALAPVDCAAEHAATLATLQAKVVDVILKCKSTTGMLGCLFEPPPSPGCVGDAALATGSDLTTTLFGLD